MHIDATDYVDALLVELSIRRNEVPEPFNTVYIGGGTPSVLPISEMLRLIRNLNIDHGKVAEFTIEANPEDITYEWCEAMLKVGVTRLSLGVQSFVDSELSVVGRRHSASDALAAISTVREAGFAEISIDLIYGLPGQTMESWKHSLTTVWNTGVTHLSAYTLTYEPGTRLYACRQAGKINETPDDLIVSMYTELTSQARDNGFYHYEISNFAIPGHEARHNSAYWTGVPYLGIGVAAHSFDGVQRRWNPRSLKTYMQTPTSSFEVEIPDNYTAHNDMVMTTLRTSQGLYLDKLNITERQIVDKYISRGMMELLPNGRCRIIEDHWLVADSIISDLFRVD